MKKREVKYRAWHTKRKRMYKVLHLHLDSPEGIWATCEGEDIIEQKSVHIRIQPKDIIVMEFTGFVDKNGKDIYEGDCVRTTGKLPNWTGQAPKDKMPNGTFYVIKHEGGFKLTSGSKRRKYQLTSMTLTWCGIEVFGHTC